jgi:hypothetical protein
MFQSTVICILRMYSDWYSECTPNVFRMYSDCGMHSLLPDARLAQRSLRTRVCTSVPAQPPYRGTAPVFVTTKLADLKDLAWWAADDPHTGHPRNGDASMIMRRLKVYSYQHRIPKPPPRLPFCGRCFAQMVINGGNPPPAA